MIISQTPLRISIAGGGTDFPGFYTREEGCVLSTAIDKYIFVIVKERFDNDIYVNYSRKEIVKSLDDLQHELVREAMRLTGVTVGVEITTLADIPSEGTGLGSSSAVTVGLLTALHAYNNDFRDRETIAREACHIELDVLGKPIGKQDQYIAAFGGMRLIRFHTDGTVSTVRVATEASHAATLQQNLMLFFTGKTRAASTILAEQSRNIDSRMDELRSLRNFAHEALAAVTSCERDRLGDVLHRSWCAKRQLATGISTTEIDALYETGLRAGALGGKVAGAGGGGFLLFYCPAEHHVRLREAMTAAGLQELQFGFERDGTKIIFNVRR